MGILDKVKNLFTEEVEEEEITKKEIIKKETRSAQRSIETVIPKRETYITHEESVPVVKVEEPKEKFVLPVYFDDKDFDDLEKPKEKVIKEEVKPLKPEPYKGAKVNVTAEPKKIFKPSPIISPVYGILDKNYTKDDIVTKEESARHISTPRKENLTIDDIRNKAYGTLEDEIDDTLLGQLNVDDIKEVVDNSEALDIFNELDFEEIDDAEKINHFNELEKKVLIESNDLDDDTEELARQLEEQKRKLEEINQYISENEVSTKEDTFENDLVEESNEEEIDNFIEESKADAQIEESNEEEINNFIEESTSNEQLEEAIDEEVKENDTNLNDSELFDLIDSMYEKRDEE